MKKTLQFLGLSLGLAFTGAVASAQRSIPLDITIVSPANGSTVAQGQFTVTINVANTSTNQNLVVGDTLYFHINGIQQEGQYSGTLLTAAINAGGNQSINIATLNNTNPGATTETELCISVIGPAQTLNGGTWENSNFEEEGCSTFSVAGATVGIEDEQYVAEWSLYPNPANEQITIAADHLSTDAQIVVHNSMGQRVYAEKVSGFRNTGAINTSEWNSGIYLVTITQNGTSRTQKVTVQH